MQQADAENRASRHARPASTSAEAPGGLAAQVRLEQTRQLYDALPLALWVATTISALVAVVAWSQQPDPAVLIWFFVLLGVTLARWAMLASWRRAAPGVERAETWYRTFCWGAFVSGLVWGSSTIVLVEPGAPYLHAILAFLVAGLGAGAAISLSATWTAACSFLLPALVPYVAAFALLRQELSGVMALIMAIFACFMLLMSRQFARARSAQIRKQLEADRRSEIWRIEQQRYRTLVDSTSAIIWECEPERLEFLYVSAEIERILGDAPSDWVGRQRFHAERIHPDDRGDALDRLEQGAVNGRRCSFDVRVRTVDGRDVWLHNDVNPYLVEGEVVRLFGVMVDVTEQRRASRTVEYVSGLQRLLVEASHALIHPVEVSLDATLDELLARVGRYCDADRAYLIRFEDGLSLFTNTHEWTAPGIAPEIENMQRESTDPLARMLESLKRREIVHLSDVAGLGDEWASERDMLLEQDILSLIVVPVYSGDELLGLVGFDSVRRRREWRSEEISLLQVLGDMVGASIGSSEAAARLRHSESLRRTAEALARMGSWEWVIETNRFHASEEWRRVFGCHEEDLERDRVLELTLEEERPRVREALKRTVEEGAPYEIEHRIVRADDGEVRWIKAHAELRHAGTPQARLVGFAQDITERRDIERELFQLAHYDSLTGLPNRVLAADRLSEALKRARRSEREVGVLFLDLDHFKKVNDTMGHEAGDQTLCEAGRRVASVLRERDSVARLGGDEFVILVEGFDGPSALTRIAEKVLEQFRRPITVMGRDVMLTASIGIAVGPADGDTPGELIRNADTAMYHAKQEGRDGFQFFDAAMNEMIVRQVAIEQALHGVVERGELSIVYHPIVAIDDRGVRALEALLRWNHPELGDPSPDEFVPIAEQTGAIRELGEFVMRESLARVADWRGNGCEDLRVTVNVSPKQFRDAGFVDFVLRELARHGLPGEALELEITEGTLLTATRGVRKALMALEASGIGIVMDDFGTGFSSLSYLREYRFDTLKIDRRFVSGITERGNDLELVRSSIRLAQALDMTAVAEGVETEEQLALLREEGCQFAQGYLFGRPLDAEGVANLLAEREG